MSNPNHRRGLMLAVILGTALTASPAPASDALAGISRYCTACWRNARLPADVWPDCTQEVFVRLLERLPTQSWSDALHQDDPGHRELLRAVDCVKKRILRARKTAEYPESGIADGTRDEEQLIAAEELQKAFDEVLTPRQARILSLWAEGYEVPEIAKELNTTAPRVSDDKYKAVRRLRDWFAERA